jgi:hypothetical protein
MEQLQHQKTTSLQRILVSQDVRLYISHKVYVHPTHSSWAASNTEFLLLKNTQMTHI